MKIYTKTGDKGYTSLLGGTRVLKSHDRIEAYGMVDELNSHIGLVRDQKVNAIHLDILKTIQDRLFTIGSSLAADPEKNKMSIPDLFDTDVTLLETEIDKMNAQLPELRSFILPGGDQGVSFCHIARTVCRRTERQVIRLSEREYVEDLIIIYLNRLSDYLFVLSRYMSHALDKEEIKWTPRK
ncbi:cob(I)yrinic acid a,c-diamide adenosyltransferase [Cytophagaceae bacterium DM2B3-1]|uniref:Corrinoid adenosyltransferase n=1 Tax=Xanthocytophaga flava TaxID=3048013 RepID=A0AAE3QVH4_9BACT|nr:cob(I)yrinic acid a,c-diamide adenosyltransferase [Xanthocytophaga flavus]MDJ1473408.1 cob(I)yrinic acid a,c-diamide adenosyltransferase [Xanthocytophaga flavus]MDJ1483549.1 cob(I)yrinic acid a,c-diamide adenosyltransferase [Xanthocytophaga flavus]MDJ1495847.1 cob(I)yrinic acid a,c-diamide adenosyltransferase [Xanthocytophaga flavus]